MDNPKAKLKVLHLIESLGSGGAERLLYTNLKHLDRAAIESEVVTVFDQGDYWREPINRLGVRMTSLRCSGYADIPAAVSRLRKYIAGSVPSVIHTHLFTANIIGRIAGRLSGIPVISSIHNPEYEPEAASASLRSVKGKIALARAVDKYTAQFCARMIAVSNYVKQSTVARLKYPASRIDVVYNPIDIAEIAGNVTDRGSVLASLNLPIDSKLVLHVGRLAPQKGFVDAVQAMPEILRSVPMARLVSVGAHADAAYKSKVVEAIQALDLSTAVLLAGERRDVASLLKACDVFVFPSRFEGLGIALVEAMVAGRACVASDIAPLTEFIHDGVNGKLVRAGDFNSLGAAVGRLLGDDEQRIKFGEAARQTAMEIFDPYSAAGKLEEIYFRVAKSE